MGVSSFVGPAAKSAVLSSCVLPVTAFLCFLLNGFSALTISLITHHPFSARPAASWFTACNSLWIGRRALFTFGARRHGAEERRGRIEIQRACSSSVRRVV